MGKGDLLAETGDLDLPVGEAFDEGGKGGGVGVAAGHERAGECVGIVRAGPLVQ